VIVVSNSSPLIALARIGRLNLLASFYQRLLIPAEVEYEVTVAGHGLPGAEEVRNADWIEVAPQNSPADPSLAQACLKLGAGERGAILPAKSLQADLLLLDEWKARRVARDAGLSVVGCLGILEAGARRGLVPDLRQAYIDLLRQGIRFDIRLLQDSLTRLGYQNSERQFSELLGGVCNGLQ
jgi:predicted nucleic acid-binding protein